MAKEKPKQKDPTKPFPAPSMKGKKPMAKIDMMLKKAMPGISMPPKKGAMPKPGMPPKGMPKKGSMKKGGK